MAVIKIQEKWSSINLFKITSFIIDMQCPAWKGHIHFDSVCDEKHSTFSRCWMYGISLEVQFYHIYCDAIPIAISHWPYQKLYFVIVQSCYLIKKQKKKSLPILLIKCAIANIVDKHFFLQWIKFKLFIITKAIQKKKMNFSVYSPLYVFKKKKNERRLCARNQQCNAIFETDNSVVSWRFQYGTMIAQIYCCESISYASLDMTWW